RKTQEELNASAVLGDDSGSIGLRLGEIVQGMGRKELAIFMLTLLIAGCEAERPKTKLVYFGFDSHAENPRDALDLAKTWGSSPPCPSWRATVKREEADFQVLFGTADVSIIDRKGQVL